MYDNIFEIAYNYRKTKLWKKLWDTQLFALQTKEDQLVFVTILGRAGEHNALTLYRNEKELGWYLRNVSNFYHYEWDSILLLEQGLQQESLQLGFENSEELTEEEIALVQAYKTKNKIRLSGKNSNPVFRKYESYKLPWLIKNQEELALLAEVTEKIISLNQFSEKQLAKLIPELNAKNIEKIPILSIENDQIERVGFYSLPSIEEILFEMESPSRINELLAAKIKRKPQTGAILSKLLLIPEPDQFETSESPHFPFYILQYLEEEGEMLSKPLITDYAHDPNGSLNDYLNSLDQYDLNPCEIIVSDERTFQFLELLANKLNIPIILEDSEIIDELEDSFYEMYGINDQMDDGMSSNFPDLEAILNSGDEALISELMQFIQNDGMIDFEDNDFEF